MSDVTAQIDALDDKQAIYQAKLVVQAASDGTPAFATMSDAAITAAVLAAVPDLALTLASPAPLTAGDAGAAARGFLRVFADAPGGAAALGTSLRMSDDSADFGFITGPVLCASVWLAISGEFELVIGGVRYRKKGLSGDQQATLLKGILPGLTEQLLRNDGT